MPDPTSSGGFNRYRYTRNNPVKFSDPSGHIPCGEISECTPSDYQLNSNRIPPFEEQEQIQQNINTTLQVGVTIWTIPVTAWTAPKALIPMLGGGTLGEAGYMGSVLVENSADGEVSLEGWNIRDGTAAFLSGEAAGLIPGSSATVSFAKGALQNGGGYALGKLFNEQTPDLGMTMLNSLSGGLAGRFADGLNSLLPSFNAAAVKALSPAVSPILSSSVVVGAQNAVINEVSEIVDAVQPALQDPGGTVVTAWEFFNNIPPHVFP